MNGQGFTRGGCAQPSASVVMPVYNAGRHLRPALDSVLAQTYRDFELVLVDDGATDGSGAVCDEYAAKDPRVVVRHGRNGGICASRNVGMGLARGKWLAFCDHDDFMEPDFLAALVGEGERTGAKIVKCDHVTYRRAEDGGTALDFAGVRRASCEWTARGLLTPAEYPFFKAVAGLVWDGVYLREFVESAALRFDESFKSGGEDFDFMTRAIAAAGGGAWVGRPLYRHYCNAGVSTSASCHLNLLDDYLRTALAERRLFADAFADASLRFSSFAEWSVPLVHFVFLARGCPLTLREQGAWLERYFDELVGRGSDFSCEGLPAKRRFLHFCARHRLFRLYVAAKRAVVALRRAI